MRQRTKYRQWLAFILFVPFVFFVDKCFLARGIFREQIYQLKNTR